MFLFFNYLNCNIELLIMKQKRSNQMISKNNNKRVSCNFFTKPIFENEVFYNFIRNKSKKKYNYYLICR